MRRSGRRARTLVVTCAAAAALLLAACDPVDGSGDGPPTPETRTTADTTAGNGEPDCATAQGRAGAMLPDQSADFRQATVNPCVPLADIAGAVLDLVPASDPEEPAIDKKAFRSSLRGLTDKVLKADSVAGCAYRTDRLAVGVYRQSGHIWSVGMVAVIRGTVAEVVTDVGICTILDQLGLSPAPTQGVEPTPGPHWQPCIDASAPTRKGEQYTILVAGTSDEMCSFVRSAL